MKYSRKQERERPFFNGVPVPVGEREGKTEISTGNDCYGENKQGTGTQCPGHRVSDVLEKKRQ